MQQRAGGVPREVAIFVSLLLVRLLSTVHGLSELTVQLALFLFRARHDAFCCSNTTGKKLGNKYLSMYSR